VILDAKKAGLLKRNTYLAETAEILIRGFARVGVVALIDEATGFQEDRARDELSRILEAYVQEALRPWVRTFPNAFFRETYRLQGWEYKPGKCKRPQYVGKLINKYIYEQLPEPVLPELQRKNPITRSGRRRHKHFQYLTSQTGIPHLDKQIAVVTTLMKISRDKAEFEQLFERAFARQQQLPLVIDVSEDEP
jgi:hypothetical protein